MQEISEQRHYRMLAKPMRQNTSQSADKNIFANLRSSEPLPSLANAQKMKGKMYDVVGSKQLREKLIQHQTASNHNQQNEQQGAYTGRTNYMQQSGLHETTNFNTTINRNTILSKITRQQQNALSREQKQLNRYKQYKQYWQNESQKLKKKTLRRKNQESLLQNNVKGLYVHPNQDKLDVLNNYVVHFWEMSLRNNDKILKRHIKGNKYGDKQLEQMLQTDKGIKDVERSIPVLPLDKLKQTRRHELSLTGRNKALSETYRSSIPSLVSTARVTNGGQSQNQQQVFKIDYTGDAKWMSMQGL